MTRIKSSQLFSILIAIRMFSIICTTDFSNADAMAGAAVSVAVQFLAVIPMLLLYNDDSFSLKKEMLFGKFGSILYIIFFIIWGAVSFSMLWEVTKSVYFPIDSRFTGSLILAAVCVYTASLGIKALSRASGMIPLLIIVSLIVMLVGAYPKAELTNFIPDVNFSNVVKYAVKEFCRSGELVMIFILLEIVPKGRKKAITSFFITKLVLTELIAAVEITVLGRIINISDFPFFSAGAFSQPMSIQRADAVYLILFTILCVVTVTVQIVLSTIIINELLPDLKYKSLISAILMLTVSSAINYTQIDTTLITGGFILVLAVIIPIIMYIRRKYHENKKTSVSAVTSDNA